MSPFHTPRCRITSTQVESNLIFRNAVEADKRLALFINAWLDPTLRGTPGTTSFEHRLVSEETGEVFSSDSRQSIANTPVGNIFWLTFWIRASDLIGGAGGWFRYDPRIAIFTFTGVPGAFQLAIPEFAAPEEPHHLFIW
jgi:hypothetical protein